MKRAEDISMLLTDKGFRKIISEWLELSELRKAEVYRNYELTPNDVEILRQLFLGLDFRLYEHPEANIEEALNETVWKLTERKFIPEEKSHLKKLYLQFSKIAAVLIIPVIFYTAYIQFFRFSQVVPVEKPEMVTVSSQPGTVTTLVLPDESKIWLNAGSSISYPNVFSGSIREVSLTGEAYFEAVKNKEMPMVVSVGGLKVKVYGTKFNVNSFPSESTVKVTLIEGSVALSSKPGEFNGKSEFFIDPGQTVTFNEESRNLDVETEDPFYYTAWKDGVIIFHNHTFDTVLKSLSRRFNIDIELKDQSLANIRMDATFRDESVNEILRLLSLSTPFSFYYEAPQKLSDGTFAKSRICIVKK